MTKYLKLNDIDCYKRAFKLSNYVWEIMMTWDWIAKKTIGCQYIDAIDSISANIAEGFGRYGKKDKIKFFRYSMGSVMESLDWTQKSLLRKLLEQEEYAHILNELKALPLEINQYIKFTDKRLKQ